MAHVLVAGGSRGIGAATVSLFESKGFNVSYFYRQAPGKNGYGIKADVSLPLEVTEGIKAAVSKYGPVDILVYSAGISQTGLSTDFTYKDYTKVMNTNFGGLFSCCKEIIPSMVSAKSGNIIAVSSMWGQPVAPHGEGDIT